jgi:hypothetical protein
MFVAVGWPGSCHDALAEHDESMSGSRWAYLNVLFPVSRLGSFWGKKTGRQRANLL